MIELSRRVRFCIPFGEGGVRGREGRNTFAAWPSMSGIGAWYELEVRCTGRPDPQTGYLINISEIDSAVRTFIVPLIEAATKESPDESPAALLPHFLDALREPLRGLVASVTWWLTPYYALGMTADATDRVLLTETFEFAAAHRLNCRGLSEDENRRLFGKCNNPSGHGHNYRVDVSVAVPLPVSEAGRAFSNLDLERIVDGWVVQRFDHKNLDFDTEEFADRNSSVENIARACYDLLQRPLADAGAELVRVRVWETEKTSCTYPA